MDEAADLFYDVLAEPVLSEPQPDDWTAWQEMAHLRTENYAWRQCLADILLAAERYPRSPQQLRTSVQERVAALRDQLARLGRLPGSGPTSA